MIRDWGLKRKFVTVFLVLITLPTVLFGFIIYFQTTSVLKEQAKEDIKDRLEKNEQSLLSILTEVTNMTSYMIYDKEFRSFFTTREEDTHRLEYKDAVEGINGYFTFQSMSNPYISSVLLEAQDGHTFKFGDPITGNEDKLDTVAEKNKGAPAWSNSYQVTSDWDGEKFVLSLSRIINDLNQINDPIGMVRVRLDQSKLYKTIESATTSQQGNYFVISGKGDVVLHQNESLVGTVYPDSELVDWVVNGNESTYKYQTNGNDFIVVKKKLAGTNWYSIAMVDEGKIVGDLHKVRNAIRDMIFLLILLGTLALVGFYQSNIQRIIELTNQTKQVESGDFTANVQVNSKDEIGRLGMRFNKMVKTIQNHINMEYKLKIKQKDSELKALQSQIDPHFLYNTLDMIRWTARLENAMETGQLIERLSKIFRMNLNNGKKWVSLEEELVYIQNYLALQKSRLGERLSFSIYADAQIKGAFLLKQILQPVVENSIQHGFKDLPRQGVIHIRCYKVDDQVWIDVIDNGWGFPSESTDNTKQTGYALKNLKDRLAFAFGEKYGMKLLETEEGTSVRLVLPLLNEEKLNVIKKEIGE